MSLNLPIRTLIPIPKLQRRGLDTQAYVDNPGGIDADHNTAFLGVFLAAKVKLSALARSRAQTVNAAMSNVGLRTAVATRSQFPRGMFILSIARDTATWFNIYVADLEQISARPAKAGQSCTEPKLSAVPTRSAGKGSAAPPAMHFLTIRLNTVSDIRRYHLAK